MVAHCSNRSCATTKIHFQARFYGEDNSLEYQFGFKLLIDSQNISERLLSVSKERKEGCEENRNDTSRRVDQSEQERMMQYWTLSPSSKSERNGFRHETSRHDCTRGEGESDDAANLLQSSNWAIKHALIERNSPVTRWCLDEVIFHNYHMSSSGQKSHCRYWLIRQKMNLGSSESRFRSPGLEKLKPEPSWRYKKNKTHHHQQHQNRNTLPVFHKTENKIINIMLGDCPKLPLTPGSRGNEIALFACGWFWGYVW